MYEFKSEYETGIAEIDSEHKQFFAYLRSAVAAMDKSEEEALRTAREILDLLSDYAETHFKHEEDYMRRTNDAELPLQLEAHNAFRARVAQLIRRRDELTLKDFSDIFIFMGKWLKTHILSTDLMIGKVRGKGKFEFTDDFRTGIGLIDDEHKTLFDIINRVRDAIDEPMRSDKFDVIMKIIGELRDYTVRHFADEEKYMASINYSGLALQKAVHEAFIDKVSDLDVHELSYAEEDQQTEYLESLVDFLADWLVNHIMNMDKKIPAK